MAFNFSFSLNLKYLLSRIKCSIYLYVSYTYWYIKGTVFLYISAKWVDIIYNQILSFWLKAKSSIIFATLFYMSLCIWMIDLCFSAGIGRSGTYIAVDYLLHQAKTEGVVDLLKCAQLMRSNRVNMIQTWVCTKPPTVSRKMHYDGNKEIS